MIVSNYTLIIEQKDEHFWVDFLNNQLTNFLSEPTFSIQKVTFFRLLSHQDNESVSLTIQKEFESMEQFQEFIDNQEFLIFEKLDEHFEGKYLYFHSYLEKI
jgi:Domain of unknown function (DUF4286)